MYDLILRDARLIADGAMRQVDIAIVDGRIAAVDASVAGTAQSEIVLTGLTVFPGLIDAHVHANDPGRSHWEGFAMVTRALAAGGATSFFDMPLNAHPPTIDADSFDRKVAAATGTAMVDFALWGGLVPGNLPALPDLARRGVVGLKAFMSNSGIEDFPAADDATLYEGMARASELGLLVAVHAENESITAALTQRARAEGRGGADDYSASRPVIAELEAIQRAVTFARATGCALHIVHVSSGEGVALVVDAQRAGVDVTCETCPHYLTLCDTALAALGALAKCAPPLRSQRVQDDLWCHVEAGHVTLVASDHSPCPPEMKTASSLFDAWGGISSCQFTLPLLITAGHYGHGLALAEIAALLSERVARRFGFWPRKGAVQVGADADLVAFRPDEWVALRPDDILYRHPVSPYIGYMLRSSVEMTVLRGRVVYHEGNLLGAPGGQLLRPLSARMESVS